ncbi:MAG: alpha-L-fucosidase [Acidobacteria bacterium]|nr:alpha-L-fucosidase [Acidobacteriota bacterium]
MGRRDFLAASCALPIAAQQASDTEAFERLGALPKHAPAPAWFSEAGLGLFLCWGICAVREVELGWGFYGDVGGKKGAWPVENYIAQARDFNPRQYDPDRWLEAAARAGFRYAVFTVRHHDGYSLWPSDYGTFSTKQHMGGRDLLRPFVEACQRHGLKVGIYYSPGNWLFAPEGWPYLGYPLTKTDFRYRRPERTLGTPRYTDDPARKLQQHFEVLYAYVKGQLKELLTGYGKIDLLWWDGYDWPRGIDIHGPETDALVRKLQPGIVTNDRYRLWSKKPELGDFSTEFENRNPEKRPEGAWEQCEAICGTWSYGGPELACKGPAHIIERMVRNRAWMGNYIASFGPRADGTMAPEFYRTCEEMAGWMKHSGESVRATGPISDSRLCDAPVTRNGNSWYIHLLGYERSATISGQPAVKKAMRLRTGEAATIHREGGQTTVTLPIGLRSDMDEVIQLEFE